MCSVCPHVDIPLSLCLPHQVEAHTASHRSRSRSWPSCIRMGPWRQLSPSTQTFCSTSLVRTVDLCVHMSFICTTVCNDHKQTSAASACLFSGWKDLHKSDEIIVTIKVLLFRRQSTVHVLKKIKWRRIPITCLVLLQVCTSMCPVKSWAAMPSRSWAGERRMGLLTGWLQTPGTMTGEIKVQWHQAGFAVFAYYFSDAVCAKKNNIICCCFCVFSSQVSSRSSVETTSVE